MTSVKGLPMVALMDLLYARVRQMFETEEWGGLRASHLRLLHFVPDDGVTITNLAERLRMTKQGCGQFVTFLVAEGYLAVQPDPADRRTRNVRRTAKGTRAIRRFGDRLARMEAEWADEVGRKRYTQFREVLAELAAGYDVP